jgi:N-methylhydantoinase A
LEVEEILRAECPEIMVTLAHRLSREYREYERMSTAVLDAYIKPITHTYLDRLDTLLREQGFRGHFLMTRSGGGAMTLATAKAQPVHLVLSGPAGGVVGARYVSRLTGNRNLITIDLGGTSLDASLVIDHEITVQTEQEFQTLPTMIPTLDITTIGAGGGSIAWIDPGGHLQVGPQSAGASPGPACYAKGGTQATLTDAALVAGYLDADNFLGGEIHIDEPAAVRAIGELGRALQMSTNQAAAGVLRISEAKIVGAVREISVERGHHPKDFALLAFGGGGGLVAAAVARELGIPQVLVPPGPANFSALGMLMVDVVHDFAQTYVRPLAAADLATLETLYQRMLAEAQAALAEDGIAPEARLYVRTAELRYSGQEHTVNVGMGVHELAGTSAGRDRPAAVAEEFSRAHEMKYGHRMDDPVEIVTLRVRAIGTLPKPELPRVAHGNGDPARAHKGTRNVYRAQAGATGAQVVAYTVYDRQRLLAQDQLAGPAIVEEPSSTTVLHTGDRLRVGDYGELVIRIGNAGLLR